MGNRDWRAEDRFGNDSADLAFHDRNRRPDIDPLIEKFCRIPSGERDTNAAVGRRVIRNGGEPVHEHVSTDLHTPWHRGIVVQA